MENVNEKIRSKEKCFRLISKLQKKQNFFIAAFILAVFTKEQKKQKLLFNFVQKKNNKFCKKQKETFFVKTQDCMF